MQCVALKMSGLGIKACFCFIGKHDNLETEAMLHLLERTFLNVESVHLYIVTNQEWMNGLFDFSITLH